MDDSLKRALVMGAGAVAGGWSGVMVVNRVGAAYGLRLGTLGTVAGAAIGAMIGASVCKKLLGGHHNLESELELEVDEDSVAAAPARQRRRPAKSSTSGSGHGKSLN